MFLKCVSPSELYNVKKYPYIRQTQPQFSHICLSSWREVPRMSLAFMIETYSSQDCRRIRILSINYIYFLLNNAVTINIMCTPRTHSIDVPIKRVNIPESFERSSRQVLYSSSFMVVDSLTSARPNALRISSVTRHFCATSLR